MAKMVFGEWQSDLGRDKPAINHKLTEWPRGLCGVRLNCTSTGFLTEKDELVTCKRCLNKMNKAKTIQEA